jgi:hypothetical protein
MTPLSDSQLLPPFTRASHSHSHTRDAVPWFMRVTVTPTREMPFRYFWVTVTPVLDSYSHSHTERCRSVIYESQLLPSLTVIVNPTPRDAVPSFLRVTVTRILDSHSYHPRDAVPSFLTVIVTPSFFAQRCRSVIYCRCRIMAVTKSKNGIFKSHLATMDFFNPWRDSHNGG